MRLWVATLVWLCLMLACARSPTGRRQLIILPEDQLVELGRRAYQEVRTERRVSRDARLNALAECVSGALTEQLAGPQREWEVTVFEGEEVNAFALPGGRIGIFEGLFEVAENQHQLATVVAHEVAHVLARHSAERISQGLVLQGGLAAIDAAMRDSKSRNFILAALGIGTQVGVLLPFSRVQEREADEIGVHLMAEAGFDPRQSVALWENMARRAGPRPPELLSTHPSPKNRIDDLREEARREQELYQRARAAGRVPDCSGEARRRAAVSPSDMSAVQTQ